MTLQNVGPAGCPAASHAGPTTSFRVAISFGTERVPENGTVMPFFSPEGGVLLYFEAHSPAQLEFVTLGHYEPPIPPFGRALTLEIPLVETVPGAPFASFKELTVGLGAFREEAGHPVGSVTAPGECPAGVFGWQAVSSFSGRGGLEPVTVISEAQSPCLPPSAHNEEEATAKKKAEAEAAAKTEREAAAKQKAEGEAAKKKLEEAPAEVARALAGWHPAESSPRSPRCSNTAASLSPSPHPRPEGLRSRGITSRRAPISPPVSRSW